MRERRKLVVALVISFALIESGCSRRVEPTYSPAPQTVALKATELKLQIGSFLTENCGTYRSPKLFGAAQVPLERLKRGQKIYAKRCVQCHGVTGGGDGPAAAYLSPKPRDYRQGVFKFGSTPYGQKPRREDLVRTVQRGISGTSMPSFRLLTKQETDDVVDYVLSLTHRGELEILLANEAAASEELEPDSFEDAADTVKGRWKEAKQQEVIPLSREPEFTQEMVAAGKQAFLTKGCAKCHGEDGRGASSDEVNLDVWGHPSKAADLTSGMLRGGSRPIDIYRRIYGGINGTRMPGFAQSLQEEPETLWQLVAFVMQVSNRRRAGEIPAPEVKVIKAATPPAGGGAPQ